MKPCDCKDEQDLKKLNEQGFRINNRAISVKPNVVIIEIENTTIKMPQSIFKKFAEWYINEQG